MKIREPVVAGQFYPERESECRRDVVRMLDAAGGGASTDDASIEGTLVGGIVPHAGWIYSGGVAARVFAALAGSKAPDSIVLFGGVHGYRGSEAALFGGGCWNTPLGPVGIDERLASRILGETDLIVEDPNAHTGEHSLEVQIPFLQHLFPDTAIVPIMVPPTGTACDVGRAVGAVLKGHDKRTLVIGTTDLTHYGPRYGFTPRGDGPDAHRWAKEENDARFIDLMCAMECQRLVGEATAHRNACSSGAAAATIAAVTVLGACRGTLLEHTTSSEVLAGRFGGSDTGFVGYAAIVFSRLPDES